MTEAAKQIADQQVRNRGTIGGSLAHGDPASDLPTVVLAMDGSVTARGPNGERADRGGGAVQDYLTTALADDEVVTDVRLPASTWLRPRVRGSSRAGPRTGRWSASRRS